MKYILVVLLFISACGGSEQPKNKLIPYPASPFNMPEMVKSPCLGYGETFNPQGPVEATPVLWHDEILIVTGAMPYQREFRIDTFDCKTTGRFKEPRYGWHPFAGHYVNAFVEGDTMYVFGQIGNDIAMVSSTDLIHWTPSVVILPAPVGMKFYNTSITRDANGYTMAVETKDSSYAPLFITHFASSVDLKTWAMLPAVYAKSAGDGVSNCPWLWFDGNMYYMLYLTFLQGQEVTLITRSADLVTWEDSTMTNNLVPFTVSSGEGNNTSDVALLEHDGKVYITYARGDQLLWLETATAVYDGTISQFVSLFF